MKVALEHALHARFLRGLERSADRPAIQVGPESVSYTAAHSLALSWAGALRHAVGDAPVAVLTGRSIEAYVGILACLYAGMPVVPLQAEFPLARTKQMLASAEVGAVIVDRAGAALVASLDLPVLAPGIDLDGIAVDPRHALSAPRPVAPSDVAYVLFTSGSTGRPKGVKLTHSNLTHYFGLMDAWYPFGPSDVFSQAAGLNWDSAVSDLWCAWGAGAGLVSVLTPSYRDIPGFLAAHGITVWFSAPSVIGLVRRTGRLLPGAMPGLRWTFFGGEALTCRDAAAWQAAAPRSSVVNVYGPTESTITTHRHTWTSSVGVNGIVPLGWVHPGHGERIVDGELWISGPQVCPGYVDPADGVDKFVTEDSRTWYRTGDRVSRAASGELVYLGRMDAQVQVGGYRVEPAEVDHALRDVPGVVEAATVGVPLDGTTVLVAFYTGSVVSTVDFARQLGSVLPQQMLPKHYCHVAELPLNTNKKIDRMALGAMAGEVLRS
jgi:amino acid adenylation domain-containing protein